MKFKGRTFMATGMAIVLLFSIALALVPPPPADQSIGLPDTIISSYDEEVCRSCHSEGVPERHHALIDDEEYRCMDCHEITEVGLTFDRDCMTCHVESPHHETQAAKDRHCSECHGEFVDDYDDGHAIPTYDKMELTPDTSYKYKEGELLIGGCEACHIEDTTGDIHIYSNAGTHHSLGNLSENPDNCQAICHGDPLMLDIRKCETCHGVNSLHKIQYNYNETSGLLGYGHIGDNWDCWGCHGSYDLYNSTIASTSNIAMAMAAMGSENLEFDKIIPSISEVDPYLVTPGQETRISGMDFMSGTGVEPLVVTLSKDGVVVFELSPDSATNTEITVTIPDDVEGSYGLNVVKCDMRSNKLSVLIDNGDDPINMVIVE